MPSLSYSELVGLVIAGALVLYPLTQAQPETAPAGAPSIAASAGSPADGLHAPFVCSRNDR